MNAPSYYDSATWISEGTIGAWTLVVGHFPEHDSYCVDHYSRADGRKQRLYFATKREAFDHVTSWGILPTREEN